MVLLIAREPLKSWRNGAFVKPILITPLVYVMLAFLSVPFSLWVGGSLSAAINLLPSIALMFVVAVAAARGGRHVVLLPLMVALGLLSLAQILKGVAVEPGRYSIGSSFDPNDMGTLLAAMLPIAVALAVQRGSWLARLVMMGCAALALVALVRTGSRGGFVTLAVAVAVTIAMLRGPKKFLLFGAAIAGMGLIIATAPPAFRTRVTGMLAGEKDYNFTERGGRLLVWQRGIGYMMANPVTGVGIANFSTAEGESLKQEGTRGAWMAPHNAYLQAGVELGIPGFFTFLLFAGYLVRHAWRTARRRGAQHVDRALLGAIVGYLAGSFFLSNAYSATLFVFAGLVAARIVSSPAAPARSRVATRRSDGFRPEGNGLAVPPSW
jgi:hypothetical protein